MTFKQSFSGLLITGLSFFLTSQAFSQELDLTERLRFAIRGKCILLSEEMPIQEYFIGNELWLRSSVFESGGQYFVLRFIKDEKTDEYIFDRMFERIPFQEEDYSVQPTSSRFSYLAPQFLRGITYTRADNKLVYECSCDRPTS